VILTKYYVGGIEVSKRQKQKRIKKSRKKAEKATKKLSKAHYRREQAEEGNLFKSLFGKP